jgi:antitoxin (DNA-binding transcriptional repressor) of toxin-antitoxin stability system
VQSWALVGLALCHKLWHNHLMPSVNIRELRDTRRLKAWLRAGETVELRERQRVIARIVPEGKPRKPRRWPDFAARQKRLFGNRILPAVETVIEGRGRY